MNRPGERIQDVFEVVLSVTRMATGLTFGSMRIIPVLYATVFRSREIDYDRWTRRVQK